MLRIVLLDWNAARAEASPIRLRVFVEEQGVPAEIELDEHDATSLHALAYLEGTAVGTGRLLPDGHIGRMAVLREARARGVGGAILTRLVDEAARRGLRELALFAQTRAIPFYRRHGFLPRGEVFEEAGIPHQEMRLVLKA